MTGAQTHTSAGFGEVLRRYRVAAGLSQEALAERASLSAHAISDLERGARVQPYPNTVHRLVLALELSGAGRAEFQGAARRIVSAGAADRGGQRPATRVPGPPMANQAIPISFTPADPLVGRERELAILHDAMVATLAGRGSLVLIGGEAGIGKTALAEALLGEAAGQGVLILVGRCYDLTETSPYGPWTEALSRSARGDDLLLVPDLASGAGAGSRAELFARVHDYLATLAARGPMALLLDDLHWADPVSIDLLRVLARGLADLPLLLLATYRSDELTQANPLYQALPMLVREARAVRLSPRPLDLEQLAILVAARYPLAETNVDRLIAYLDRRAEGNPFFARELLHALQESGLLRPPNGGDRVWTLGDLSQARLSSVLRQVIDGRAARLGESARDVLEVAAVIGQEVRPDLWAGVVGADGGALLPVIEAALEARLLTTVPDSVSLRFAHALVREALYEGTPPLRRALLHQRIGETLAAESGPDPDAVASHLRRAGDPRAAEWLTRAGDRARVAWAWQSAAARYNAALTMAGESGQTDERGWLLYRLAQVGQYADARNALPAAEEAAHFAEATDDRALRACTRSLRGFVRFGAGELSRGLADLEAGAAGLETLSAAEEARLRVRLAPDVAPGAQTRALLLSWVGRYAEARHLAEPWLSESPASCFDSFAAMRDVYAAGGEVEAARQVAALGREAARSQSTSPFIAGYWPFCDLIMIALPYAADDLDWRRDLQRQAEAGFERAGGMVSSQAVRAVRLPLLSLEGHWLEALETGHAAWAVRESGEAWWDRVTAPVLATIALARGEPATAWALVRAHHPSGPATAPGNTYFHAGLTLQRLAAALAIDADNLDEARSWLTAHDRWLAWSGAVLGRAEGAAAWAAYHRAAGDPALARQYSERALAFAEAPRQPLALLGAHRVLGEVDTAAGRRAEADDHLNAALALADACAAPFERALTLLALAELRHASEEDAVARRLLDAARAICFPLGARPALDRAEALVARLSAQDSCGSAFPARLTAREEEVLRLVAQGLSNSGVAARLFLSTRTIEQHLRSIYDKLDVSSRTAAAHFATEHHLI